MARYKFYIVLYCIVYRTSFCVIVCRSYKLLKMIRFLGPPCTAVNSCFQEWNKYVKIQSRSIPDIRIFDNIIRHCCINCWLTEHLCKRVSSCGARYHSELTCSLWFDVLPHSFLASNVKNYLYAPSKKWDIQVGLLRTVKLYAVQVVEAWPACYRHLWPCLCDAVLVEPMTESTC